MVMQDDSIAYTKESSSKNHADTGIRVFAVAGRSGPCLGSLSKESILPFRKAKRKVGEL